MKNIFILLFVLQNVCSMITKKKSIFKNLNEFGNAKSDEENGTSTEQQKNLPLIEPPKVQKMIRGEGNEYILQWLDNYEAQQKTESQDKKKALPFKFIKVHISEMENILAIDAQVEEEEDTSVEICLCDEKREICDGPFEAMENFGGKIDTKLVQCVKLNYQTILAMNKMVRNVNKLMVKAQFRINYNWYSLQKQQQNESKREAKSALFKMLKRDKSPKAKETEENQKEFRNCQIGNLLLAPKIEYIPRRLDQEFFLKISYESKSSKKVIRMWTVQKCVKFAMLPSLYESKL